jgi:hypothetical protein
MLISWCGTGGSTLWGRCILNGLPIPHAACSFCLFLALAAINRVSVPFRAALYGTGVQPSGKGSSEERIDLHAGKQLNYAEGIFGSTTLSHCSHALRNPCLRIAYVMNGPAWPNT